MPRFHVVLADTADGSIRGHIVTAHTAADAVCSHPWFTEVYQPTWIDNNVRADLLENMRANIWSNFSWSLLCANLDEEIMNALNGGDLSASSLMQQH